ncbi:MAG: hypothetical protein ACON4Z_02640 [Planctomycetota bacterium]
MTHTKNLLVAAAAAGILVTTAAGQRLATYDPALPLEFAAASCPSAPAFQTRQNLAARTPSSLPRHGAIAADNVNRVLFTTTGRPADGIDAVPFLAVGTGATPTNYPAPPGFAQVTGMCIDPINPSGTDLLVTDGYQMAPYDYATGTLVLAPQPIPVPTGTMATGLCFDVWTHDVVVVCSDATLLRVPIGGGPWTVSPPAVPVPPLATGVAVCGTAPSAPMVSFFDGTVMDPQSGAVLPFPGAALGAVRRHRGMTFFARPIWLGGKGLSLAPQLQVKGSYQAGSMDCKIETENVQGLVLIAVDLAPAMVPIAGHPKIDGTLLINPGTSATAVFPPGLRYLPIDLSNAPAGAALVAQAATIAGGQFHMSDAAFFQTWL